MVIFSSIVWMLQIKIEGFDRNFESQSIIKKRR